MIDTTQIEQKLISNDNKTVIGIPNPPPLPIMDTVDSTSYNCKSTIKLYSPAQPVIGYRGLVNQAMTCYLNSLLQALFMTPEFRNALYKWEFDGDGESKSIPYQLQKLFLNMQVCWVVGSYHFFFKFNFIKHFFRHHQKQPLKQPI